MSDDVPPPYGWASRHPVAAELEAALPSAGLAGRLGSLCVADLDDPALLEVVAAWERLAAWCAGQQAVAVAEMVRRAPGIATDLVPDDVAVRIGHSRRRGEAVVELAVGLGAFPEVHDALLRGEVDARKAQAMLVRTDHLPDAVARDLLCAVLPDASTSTVPQLGAALRRAEIARDPAASTARHERARAERCVRMVPSTDSMAWIHALLPAPDAVTVMTAVDALAAAAAPDDDRGIDQRRADAMTDTFRQVLDTGMGRDGTPLPARQHQRPHLQVVVSARQLPPGVARGPARGTGEPTVLGPVAELRGFGPLPTGALLTALTRGVAASLAVEDPLTGELVTLEPRGSSGSASYRPAASVARRVTRRDATCTFPGCRVRAERCDLDHLVAFDPARPAAEQTVPENLHALCRHHHRLKTSGRWRPSRDDATGVTAWVSATGHRYTRDPLPAHPDEVPRRTPRPTAEDDVPRRTLRPTAEDDVPRRTPRPTAEADPRDPPRLRGSPPTEPASRREKDPPF